MSFSHTVALSYSANGGVVAGTSYTVTAGLEVNLSEEITAPSTDQLVACTLDVSQMKTLFLYCAEANLTIETNSAGSPAATVSLQAGKPLIWESTQGQTNPFGVTDVTALYITLGGTTDATLEMRCLVDPTV